MIDRRCGLAGMLSPFRFRGPTGHVCDVLPRCELTIRFAPLAEEKREPLAPHKIVRVTFQSDRPRAGRLDTTGKNHYRCLAELGTANPFASMLPRCRPQQFELPIAPHRSSLFPKTIIDPNQ